MHDIVAKVQSVEGWLHPREMRKLFELAKESQGRGAIIEVGSWKGKSTICLASGSRAGRGTKIHAIDPHTGSPEHAETLGEVRTFKEFQQNIRNAGVEEVVIPHVEESVSAAEKFKEPVEVAFIDGLHEYEGVKADFEAWFPKVVDGGMMAFHDTSCWPGPLKVVSDCLFKSRQFRRVRFVCSLTYGQKVAQNTFLERFENRVMLCAFRIHAVFDRKLYRFVHTYLDFPTARAFRQWVRGRPRLEAVGEEAARAK
jgi:predicted O-methyltransferase YrrM